MTNSIAVNPDAKSAAADPLGTFIALHRRSLPPSRGNKRFNSGEHAWLADRGAELACDALGKRGIHVDRKLFSAIRRRTGRDELQYGELVALSGDFYETPDALFDEAPSPFPWLWQDNDLDDLRKIFAEEIRWIDARQHGRAGPVYPEASIRLAWNAKSYVELALRNTDHFGWHNVSCYCKHHARALELAASANGREGEMLRQALYTNAFADHFLTDGFAAGHVRVPRAEIRAWATENGWSEQIAGGLSKLLHDQDGHVDLASLHGVHEDSHAGPGDGLLVRNATGASWRTFCDGQLFLDGTAVGADARARAVDAVCASVSELLLAWKRRDIPPGVYAATRHVPFPDPETPALVDKFPANLSGVELDALWNSIAWYAKVPWIAGLTRDHVHALLEALPGIMQRFRANIATAAQDPELRRRVDARYIEAYCHIA